MDTMVKSAQEALDKEEAAARWETIGQYYLLAEKPEEGAEIFEKVWKEFPETAVAPRAALRYTDLLVHLKRYEEALEVLQQIQADNPMSQLGNEAQRRIPLVRNIQAQAESTTPALTLPPPSEEESPEAGETQ
jgi:tetratricopeptide (TPR) repeat protein